MIRPRHDRPRGAPQPDLSVGHEPRLLGPQPAELARTQGREHVARPELHVVGDAVEPRLSSLEVVDLAEGRLGREVEVVDLEVLRVRELERGLGVGHLTRRRTLDRRLAIVVDHRELQP